MRSGAAGPGSMRAASTCTPRALLAPCCTLFGSAYWPMRLANAFSIPSWPPAPRAAGSQHGAPNGPMPPMAWRPSVPSIVWTVCWTPCLLRSTNSAPPTPPGCSSTCRGTGRRATASVRTRRACRRTPASAKRSPDRRRRRSTPGGGLGSPKCAVPPHLACRGGAPADGGATILSL
jgi:hypothetical protein